jgi:membrane fusion protein, multidrug efflux system
MRFASCLPLLSSLMAAGILLLGCRPAESAQPAAGGGARRPQPVEVAPVERRDLAETLTLVGTIAANESAQIRPEISGVVREIRFEEGQLVEAGHLLVKLDDAELLAQLEQAKARFRLAELNLARSESLAESRTIPQADIDRARSEFASSQAEISLLQVRLDKSEIRAPFSGVVGGRSISPGDFVSPTAVITSINDLSSLKIEFQVPERFIAYVEPGSNFRLTSAALDRAGGQAVEGQVYFVSSAIDRASRSSEVKGLLRNPPTQIRPGMFASVELVLRISRGALTVAEGAILSQGSGFQIVAVREKGEGSVAEFIPVRLGIRSRGYVEVEALSGSIEEGMPVVSAGVGGIVLFPGAAVNPRPLNSAFRS